MPKAKRPVVTDGSVAYVSLAGITQLAIIDAEDVELVGQYNWHRYYDGWNSYAVGKYGLQLHRLVLGVTHPKIQVDHIDHNGLDCRKHNLRLSTSSSNQLNRSGANSNSISGVLGVSPHTPTGSRLCYWRASLKVNRKQHTRCFPFTDEGLDEAKEWLQHQRQVVY